MRSPLLVRTKPNDILCHYLMDKPSYLSADVRLLCWKIQAVERLWFSGT
jgi:hypothetical protein